MFIVIYFLFFMLGCETEENAYIRQLKAKPFAELTRKEALTLYDNCDKENFVMTRITSCRERYSPLLFME